jgi:hypothetical protein
MHIELAYRQNGYDITVWYAVPPDLDRAARAWAQQRAQTTVPTASALHDFLREKGAKLDRADGPALVMVSDGGTRITQYLRDNKYDRDDGPAVIGSYRDGTLSETWFHGDNFEKSRTSTIASNHDGTFSETWCHIDGVKLHGPGARPSSPAP